jgi:hypothetical protein
MIKSYLNKGISSSVAILVILFLAILVIGFIYWQYLEIWRGDTNLLEIKIPEKVDGTADWKNHENVAMEFCKKEDGIVKYFSLLNFDQNTKKEIFVMCATSDWSFWTPGGQGVLNLYVLEGEDENYQIIWQKNTSDDFNLRAVREPKIVDIDRDGIDEIILAGSSWGGTCTYSIQFNFIYSPKYNEVFSIEERKGIKLSEDKVFCIEKARKYNSGCKSWDINSVCFSNHLKKSEYKIFKTYLENLLVE